jgi:DNA-binding LytR/AlgR family response regulator
MIHAIAIDDEPKAINVMKHHINKIENIKLIDCFYNAKDAIAFLKQNPIDVVFLDINMPHKSGLEMLNDLKYKPEIVFTTAYSEYAVESYEYNAIDYLLKPFDLERFLIAVEKIEKRIEEKASRKKTIFVKDGLKTVKIELSDILYVKGSGNYLDVVTFDKVYCPRMTFNEILQKLPSSYFLRVHQSYVVNIETIEKLEHNHIYYGDLKVPIGVKYKEVLMKRINV